MHARRALLFALCLATPGALASGFSFGENGARAFSMGGAFVAQADDLSALQHNPAGLSQLDGFQFLLDGQLFVHNVEFQRTNAAGSVGPADTVTNSGGPFVTPLAAVSYGFAPRGLPLTFALGVYGPPAVGRYAFPAPDYTEDPSTGRYVQNPAGAAPQRYAVIGRNTFVAFPSLAVSFAPHRTLSLGGTLQYVVSHFAFTQAISAALYTPNELSEDPAFDNLARIDVTGRPRLTGVLGARFRPADWLAFGFSLRPPTPIHARGTMDVEFGEIAAAAGSQLSSNRADLSLTLPLEVKLGVHFRPLSALGLNADVVYEGWSALREIVLTPNDVVMTSTLTGPRTLEPVRLDKRWVNTWGGRFGGEYAFPFGLDLRAGVLFERGAAPSSRINLDFPNFTRTFLTAGAGWRFRRLEVVGAFAFTPDQTVEVRDSEVRGVNALGITGSVIGNGNYTSGGVYGSVGVRGRFGGQPESKGGLW